jgi:tRNA G37 N-methylase TrmD
VTPPAHYKLSVDQAADLINCAPDLVRELAKSGILRSAWRKGKLQISAVDVAEYIDRQHLKPKKCGVEV